MARTRYKIINEKTNKGDWLESEDLIKLIKLCDKRNTGMKKQLIEMYEFLENEKFNEEWIKGKKKLN